MRINVRRLQPGALFASFLGVLDIKLGCEIILLFGLINKVAGVYGLITVFVGGTFVQYLFYAYSIASLFAFGWALKVVKSENAHKTLQVAHLYTLDHIILQVFHYIFYYTYWFVNAHDGKRVLNSQAQIDILDLAVSRGEVAAPSEAPSDDIIAVNARTIWDHEKGYALGVVSFGFLLKFYFILILYSYAAHLRSSSYHNLPLTTHSIAKHTNNLTVNTSATSSAPNGNGSARAAPAAADQDDDDRELASAEAEVARIHEEANGTKTKSKDGKKDDDDFDSWE